MNGWETAKNSAFTNKAKFFIDKLKLDLTPQTLTGVSMNIKISPLQFKGRRKADWVSKIENKDI